MATVTGTKRHLAITSTTYDSSGDVVVGGNLTVEGTTTTLDTANLLVEDKNIIIGNVTTPSDTTADGGGITLKGASDYTINWVNANDRWEFNQGIYSSGPITSAGKISGTELEGTSLDINGAADISTGGITTAANHFQLNTPSGYIQIGAMNTSHAHIYTDRASFYTNKPILVSGDTVLTSATGVMLSGNQTISGIKTFTDNLIAGNSATDKTVVVGNLGIGPAAYPKVAYPGTNAQWGGSGTTTGQIVIDLPGTLNNYDMMYMEIDIYEYSSENATKFIIGGHNWNSGGDSNTSSTMWHNVGVTVLGTSNKSVYFGWRNDGTSNRRVVAIGETNSSWSYGTVHVSKVSGASDFYTSAIDWVGDWGINQTTSTSYFTKSPTTNFNTTTATTFKTTGLISSSNISGTTSGTNTGDQDLSGYSLTSHNHDDRYYTETELDAGQLDNRYYTETEVTNLLSGKTELNHLRSLGTTAFTGTATTAGLISEMEGDGAFDSYSSLFKTSWSYAGNFDLSDAGRFTETAGSSWITWTDNSSDSTRGNITALAIAPNTGGSAGKVFIYNDQGSGYAPGWREVWTSTSDGAGSGLDADLLDGLEASAFALSSVVNQSDFVSAANGGTFSGDITVNGDVLLGGSASDPKTVTIQQIVSTSTENTAIMHDGNGVLKTRNLGSNAFNSTTIPTDHGDHDGLYLPIGGGTLTGDLSIPQYLYHAGDTNTYLRFRAADDVELVAGGRNVIRMDEGTNPDKVQLGDSSTITYTEGSVGIGITNPTYKLHITDSTASGRAVQGIQSATSGTNYGAVFTAEGSGATKNVGLYADAQGATTNYAAIFDNGNVGIGTTSPSFKLHVNSAESGVTAIGVSNTSSGAARVYLDASNGDFAGSDYMWIGQNNDLSGEIFMPQSAGSFNIKTQPGGTSTTQFTVTQAGNIGIGTTSPSSKLEVYASGSTVLDIQGSQGQLFSITDDLTGDLFSVSDISGVPIFNVNSSGLSTFDGEVDMNTSFGGSNFYKVGIGTTTNGSIFAEGKIFTQTNFTGATGNILDGLMVGATGSPSYKLHVKGGNDAGIIAERVTSGTEGQIYMLASDTSNVIASKGSGNNTKKLIFTIGIAPRVSIDTTGNVGIGDTAPLAKLHIAEYTSNTYARLRLQGHNRGGIIEMWNGTSNPVSSWQTEKNGDTYFATAGALGSISLSTKMTILTGGNVGIGVTNPGEKLVVNGNVTATKFYGQTMMLNWKMFHDTTSIRTLYKDGKTANFPWAYSNIIMPFKGELTTISFAHNPFSPFTSAPTGNSATMRAYVNGTLKQTVTVSYGSSAGQVISFDFGSATNFNKNDKVSLRFQANGIWRYVTMGILFKERA